MNKLTQTKRSWMAVISAWVVTALVAGATPAFSDQDSRAGVRRALLIGIGKYEALPRLPGSKNDIALVHQVLQTRYGFAESDIRVIRDEEATRAGVVAALNEFVGSVGPNDTAYIHYSGHGSQVEDVNGDEQGDQLDETLVPYDGRTDGVPDITDDELEGMLSKLRTTSAVVVLDSCHSGTATRGLEVRVRSVPRDRRVELYQDAAVRTRAIVPMTSARYVLFSGAASHEEALDGPVNGRYHGFFTHSLFKSLQAASPDASPRVILAGAKDELKRIQNQFGRSSMPEPQLEAPKARLSAPLFVAPPLGAAEAGSSHGGAARRPWVAISAGKGDQAVLSKAAAIGGAPGSVWGVYPSGETDFDPQQALAFAHIVSTQGQDAIASVAPRGVSVPRGARATLLVPATPSGAVPVRFRRVDADKHGWLLNAVRQRLGEITVVNEGEFARFIVDVDGAHVRIYSADAMTQVAELPVSRTAQTADAVAQVLMQSRNAAHLVALENPASKIQLDVRVVQVSDRGIAVVSDKMEAPIYRIRRAGEPRTLTNSLQLEVRANADCYITIVDVDAEGKVNVLFPNPYQSRGFYPDGFIRAHTSALFPDSLRSGNRAGFHFDYANPPGVDTIRVFASTDRRLAERIRRIAGTGVSQAGASFVERPAAQLVRLQGELVGTMTRGLITVPDEPSAAPAATPEPAARPSVESMGHGGVEQVMNDSPGQEQPLPDGLMDESPMYSEATHDQQDPLHGEMAELDTAPVVPVSESRPAADWTAASVTVLVAR